MKYAGKRFCKLLLWSIFSLALMAGCGGGGGSSNNNSSNSSSDTTSGSAYYEIYGAQAGDYNLSKTGHQLIGSSNSGNIFNISGYSRFIIYVPSTSSKILFDAIGLDSGWVNSQAGTEYAHYTSNMDPTGTSWAQGDSYIEGAPDGLTMENTVGSNAYYGFTTNGASTLTIYIKGAAPSGLSASAGNGEVTINWSGVSGATSYNIYWSTAPGVTKTTGTKITGATSPHTHTSLTNGTTYYYVVTAVNSYGESRESSQVSETPATTCTIPSVVQYPFASASDGQVTVGSGGFYFISPGEYYNIYWSTTPGVTKSTGTKITSMTGSYIHTGLSNGTTYYYVVTRANSCGESNESSEVSATPMAASPTPTTLAAGLNDPSDIAVDSTSVYWTEYNGGSGGTVKKVGINGGTVTTLASGLSGPFAIAIDSTNVYWVEYNSGIVNGGTVKKVGINGGTVTTLASGLSSPRDIAVDSTNVYWVEVYDSVKKISINGGTVTTLATTGGLSGYCGVAVDSTNVYWTEELGDVVKKIGINGGTVTTLASGLTSPCAIAIDSTNVYWGEAYAVKKVSINGGTVTTLSSTTASAGSIAIDSTNVYWVEAYSNGSGAVKKVGINGGTLTTLVSEGVLTYPGDIAVDSTNVYWILQAGRVDKIAKE